MSRSMFLRLLLPLAGLLLALAAPGAAGLETLDIPGSGACEVVLRDLAQNFNAQNPGCNVVVPASIDSLGGIRRVADGRAVLGRISRPLEEKERTLGLQCLTFARDLIIFAVNAQVAVQNLTTDQVVGIFSGRITDWGEVGGRSGVVRVLVREPSDSSLRVIRREIPRFRELSFGPDGKMVFRNYEMVPMLQKYRHAIGWLPFTSLSGRSGGIKPLSLDGVEATPENLEAGHYKLAQDFTLIYQNNRLNLLARDFLAFIFSEAGAAIIRRHGAIPVKHESRENLP